MITRTFRINKFLYEKIKLIAKHNHVSINSLMIELLEIGYLEMEKRYNGKNKSL